MDKKKRKYVMSIVLLGAVSIGLGSALTVKVIERLPIVVELEASDYFSTIGGNKVSIMRGEDAEFNIVFKAGYDFDEIKNYCTYKEDAGLVTVNFPNVTRKSTVRVYAYDKKNIMFNFVNDNNLGTVTSEPVPGYYPAGTEVHVHVTPKPSSQFVGWSLNQSIFEGEITNILSNGHSWTFDLTSDENLNTVKKSNIVYSNYYVSKVENENKFLVQYELNGGTRIGDSDTLLLSYEHPLTYYHTRINSLQGSRYFEKEGATLTSWNTKVDGSGKRIGLGSKISQQNAINQLYAQWENWSNEADFIFNEENEIVSYIGTGNKVVIPNFRNDGSPINKINGSAFSGNDDIIELILNGNLSSIDYRAFYDCQNLQTITMFDGITFIHAEAFYECNNIKTIYINAATNPRRVQSDGSTIADKIDLIISAHENNRKKVITFSDAITYVGIDSSIIYRELSGQYDVINLSGPLNVSPSLLLSIIAPYITEDDILLNTNWFGSINNLAMNTVLWNGIESNYDLFSYIDLTNCPEYNGTAASLLTSFSSWNAVRLPQPETTYESRYWLSLQISEDGIYHGDSFKPDNPDHDETWSATTNSLIFSTEGINFGYLNHFYGQFNEIGAMVFHAFPIWNVNSALESELTTGADNYMIGINEKFDGPVLGHVSDYGLTGQYFATNAHPSYSGAQQHARLLVRDLKSMLFY